jgi:hypothetical protein
VKNVLGIHAVLLGTNYLCGKRTISRGKTVYDTTYSSEGMERLLGMDPGPWAGKA